MGDIAKKFIRIFKSKVEKLYSGNLNLISGRKTVDILGYHEHTYLINIAVFLTIKEINKENHMNLSITPEPGGRSPSDFAIIKDEKNVQLNIEHENAMHRIAKNFKKLIKSRKGHERLLICYVYTKNQIKDTIDQLKKYRDTKKPVHILIAQKSDKSYFTGSKDYKHFLI